MLCDILSVKADKIKFWSVSCLKKFICVRRKTLCCHLFSSRHLLLVTQKALKMLRGWQKHYSQSWMCRVSSSRHLSHFSNFPNRHFVFFTRLKAFYKKLDCLQNQETFGFFHQIQTSFFLQRIPCGFGTDSYPGLENNKVFSR